MKSNSFDIALPIVVLLAMVAAWQFYTLAWGLPVAGTPGVEVAASPPAAATLRPTDPLGN